MADQEALSGIEKPLFYAYARRTDHPAYSRYFLTFADAGVADELWELIKTNYPDDAERPNAQLFSFKGDNFVGKIWQDAKFEHLKTKWMYSQMGDANNTGGRQQDIIPVQTGASSSGQGGSAGSPGKGGDQGDNQGGDQTAVMGELLSALKGMQSTAKESSDEMKAIATRQAASLEGLQQIMSESAKNSNDAGGQAGDQSGQDRDQKLDLSELLAALKDMQSAAKEHSQEMTKSLSSLQQTTAQNGQQQHESFEALQYVMEESAGQGRDVQANGGTHDDNTSQGGGAQAGNVDRLQALVEQSALQIRELAAHQAQTNSQIQALRAGQADLLATCDELLQFAKGHQDCGGSTAGGSSFCTHDVRKPPRKLNRPLAGYVYEGFSNGAATPQHKHVQDGVTKKIPEPQPIPSKESNVARDSRPASKKLGQPFQQPKRQPVPDNRT